METNKTTPQLIKQIIPELQGGFYLGRDSYKGFIYPFLVQEEREEIHISMIHMMGYQKEDNPIYQELLSLMEILNGSSKEFKPPGSTAKVFTFLDILHPQNWSKQK